MNKISLLLLFAGIVLSFLQSSNAQVWIQTSGTPEGGGVTDMVVRESNQNIFVTTASINWPNGDMGGIRRSTDDGATWENLMDVYNGRTIIDAPDGNLYASIWPYPQDEGLYRSTDNGDNWGNPLVTVPTGSNIFSIAVNVTTDPYTIFAGTRNGPLRSIDNGMNWSQVVNGIPANSWVRDIEVDSEGTVVAATTNGVFSSTDNGDAWQQATGIAAGDTIVKIMFDYPLTANRSGADVSVIGGSDNGKLYRAFGQAEYLVWTLLALFEPDVEVSGTWLGVVARLTKKCIGSSFFPKGLSAGGFRASTDNGNTWIMNNNGLPSDKVSALAGRTNKGMRGTEDVYFYLGLYENINSGAGVFKTTYTITDVNTGLSAVPDGFNLEQNYPNPFNPVTIINYQLAANNFVTLKVYSALGEEVATLVNEEKPAGNYQLTWNAADKPSGVYFYRLRAGSFVRTRKMILLK
jgi:hypothetical protein